MRTFVSVLILELDETEGNPAKWDWNEIVGTPGSIFTPSTIEVETDPTDEQVELLARLSADYRNAVRDVLGVVDEVTG